MKYNTYFPIEILERYNNYFLVSENEKESEYNVFPSSGLVIGFQYKGQLSTVMKSNPCTVNLKQNQVKNILTIGILFVENGYNDCVYFIKLFNY